MKRVPPCETCVNIDYSEVKLGRIKCRDCPRVWNLRSNVGSNGNVYYHWHVDPHPDPKFGKPFKKW